MEYFANQNIQVSWNLSQSIIQEMSNLFQRADDNYINRNYSKAFECYRTIKQRAIQSFNPEERKKFQAIEEEILLSLSASSDENIKNNHPALFRKAINNIFKKLDEYNTLLMDTLNKYNYLIPPKKDRTKLIG